MLVRNYEALAVPEVVAAAASANRLAAAVTFDGDLVVEEEVPDELAKSAQRFIISSFGMLAPEASFTKKDKRKYFKQMSSFYIFQKHDKTDDQSHHQERIQRAATFEEAHFKLVILLL